MLSGATVRSVAHVSSLSVYSRTHAPGEKPVLEGVYEQRVTALCVHILICKFCTKLHLFLDMKMLKSNKLSYNPQSHIHDKS